MALSDINTLDLSIVLSYSFYIQLGLSPLRMKAKIHNLKLFLAGGWLGGNTLRLKLASYAELGKNERVKF